MIEIWKDIPEYEGLYKVSNLGGIKSLARSTMRSNNKIFPVEERILKQSFSREYLRVKLYKNKAKKSFSVHILVAMAFLNHIVDNENQIVVDHINNDHLDNRLENLQIINHRLNTSKDKKRELPTGVYKNGKNHYQAQIRFKDQKIYLGTFTTIEEASNAYQNALNN